MMVSLKLILAHQILTIYIIFLLVHLLYYYHDGLLDDETIVTRKDSWTPGKYGEHIIELPKNGGTPVFDTFVGGVAIIIYIICKQIVLHQNNIK